MNSTHAIVLVVALFASRLLPVAFGQQDAGHPRPILPATELELRLVGASFEVHTGPNMELSLTNIPMSRIQGVLRARASLERMPPREDGEGPAMFFMDGHVDGLPGVWMGSPKAKVIRLWGSPTHVVPAQWSDEGLIEEEYWLWSSDGSRSGARLYFDHGGRVCASLESIRRGVAAREAMEEARFIMRQSDDVRKAYLEVMTGQRIGGVYREAATPEPHSMKPADPVD
jgi:hypothetical protein